MKDLKRIMSFLLAIILLYGAICNCIYAISEEIGEGVKAGASANVITIDSFEELKKFKEQVNNEKNDYTGKTVKLTSNIDIDNSWESGIGTFSTPFKGTFDGNGYVLTYKDTKSGVFNICQSATIKNLTVKGNIYNKTPNISNSPSIGGIVNWLIGGTIESCINEAKIGSSVKEIRISGIVGFYSENVKIKDCINKGILEINTDKSYGGGIVGKSDNESTISIENCENYGNIKIGTAIKETITAGGIIGSFSNATIRNCLNYGNITGIENNENGVTTKIGGIAGETASGTITNCYNKGKIVGKRNVGGIVGYNKTEISFCMNDGKIQGTVFVGGIAGFSENNIKYCYDSKEAELLGEEYIGGIVGETKGEILNCINEADIKKGDRIGGITARAWKNVKNCSNTANISGKNMIGGIVGWADTVNGETAEFNNCFNYGSISGQEKVGGIVGTSYGYSIKNCYNIEKDNSNILGSVDVGGIAGIYNWESGTNISNCANNMEIRGYFDTYGPKQYLGISIGGIIGTNIGSKNGSGIIEVCKNLGDIYGKENVGGIIGASDKFYYIINSINDANVSGDKYVGGLLGKSVNESDLDKEVVNKIEASYVVENSTIKGNCIGIVVGNCVNLKLISMPLQGKVDQYCGHKDKLDVSKMMPENASNIINVINNANKGNDEKLKIKPNNYSFLTNGSDNFKVINGKPILKIELEEITFEDENLKNGVEKNLKDAGIPFKSEGKTITLKKEDISKVKTIEVTGKKVKSIEGLRYFTNLENLYLSRNQIVDIDELEYLPNLINVFLDNNSIKDAKKTIEILLKRKSIVEITVANNCIEDDLSTCVVEGKTLNYYGQSIKINVSSSNVMLSDLPAIIVKNNAWDSMENCKVDKTNLIIIDTSKKAIVNNKKIGARLEINTKVNSIEAKATQEDNKIILNINLSANPNLVDKIIMNKDIENYIVLKDTAGNSINQTSSTYVFADFIYADSKNSSEKWTESTVIGKISEKDARIELATGEFVYNVELALEIDIRTNSLDIAEIEIKDGLFYTMKGSIKNNFSIIECEIEKQQTQQTQQKIKAIKVNATSPKSGIYREGQVVTFAVKIEDGTDLSNVTKENTPTLKLYFQDFTENDTKYIASKNTQTTTFNKVSGSYIYYTYTIQKGDVGIIRIKSYTGKINNIDVEYTGRAATYGNCIKANATDNVVDEIVYKESIKINGEDAKTNSRDVGLTLKFDPNKTVGYCISETNSLPEYAIDFTEEQIRDGEAKIKYTLSEGDGDKTVYAWFKYNNGDYTSNALLDTITLDTTIVYTLQINGNEAITAWNSVFLGFTGEVDCDQMLIVEEKLVDTTNILENQGWINFQNDYEYEIKSQEDGVKTIYVYLRKGDTVLNNSQPLEDQIELKTDKGGAIVNNDIKVEKFAEKAFAINPKEVEFDDGNVYYLSSDYTTNKTVVIKFYGVENASKMFISDGTTVPSPDSDEGWVDYKEEATYTLSEGDGEKYVYVWFKNDAGKSTAWYSSSIRLDTQKPTIKVSKIDIYKEGAEGISYWSWDDTQENPGVVKFRKNDILKICLKTDEENLKENYYLNTYVNLYNKETGESFSPEGSIIQFDEKGEAIIQIKYGEIIGDRNYAGMPEKFVIEWNYAWLRDAAGQMQDERESIMSFEIEEKAPEHIKTTCDFENGSQVGTAGDKIIFKSEYNEKVTNEILPKLQVNFENGITVELTAEKVEEKTVFYSYEATSEEQGEILSTNLIGEIKDIIGNVQTFTEVESKTNLLKNAINYRLANSVVETEISQDTEVSEGIYIDNQKPTIKVSKNGSEEYISQEEDIFYTISDDYELKSIEYVWKTAEDISDVDYSKGYDYQLSKLADENPLILPEEKGEYKLYLRVTDRVGNTQEMVSETYKIDEKAPTINIVTSEKYEIIDGEVNYISKIAPQTEKSDLIKNINVSSENATIKIYALDGQEITEGKIATGMKAKVINGTNEKEYILIVTGDVDSNGKAEFDDILKINGHRLDKYELDGIYVKAGDINEDEVLDFDDILLINKIRTDKI